jgi:hypothetical protein
MAFLDARPATKARQEQLGELGQGRNAQMRWRRRTSSIAKVGVAASTSDVPLTLTAERYARLKELPSQTLHAMRAILMLVLFISGCFTGPPAESPAGEPEWILAAPSSFDWPRGSAAGTTDILLVAGQADTEDELEECNWIASYVLDFVNATLWYDPAQFQDNLQMEDSLTAVYVLEGTCPASIAIDANQPAFIPVIRNPCFQCMVEGNAVGLPSLVWDQRTRELGIGQSYMTDESRHRISMAANTQTSVHYADGATISHLRVVALSGWDVRPLSASILAEWTQSFPWD